MKKIVLSLVLISLLLFSGCNNNSSSVIKDTPLDVEIKYDDDVPDENKLIKVVKNEEKGVLIINPKDKYSIDLPDWWEGKFSLEVTKANHLFVFHVSPAKYGNMLFRIGKSSKEDYDMWIEDPDDLFYIVNEEKGVYLFYNNRSIFGVGFMNGEEEYEAEYKKMVKDVDKLEDYIVYD